MDKRNLGKKKSDYPPAGSMGAATFTSYVLKQNNKRFKGPEKKPQNT